MRFFFTLAFLTIVLPQYEGKAGCAKLNGELSQKNGAFIQCVGNNAVPVNFCIECGIPYNDMETAYNNLLNGTDTDDTKCAPKFTDNDRLNVIINTELSFKKIWTDAFCNNCYNADGTISNETQSFRTLSVHYKNCQESHPNNQYCESCKESYDILNSQYKTIKADYKDNVCFDLKDDMNRTRSNWTKVCGHERPKASLVVFSAVSSVLSTIPLIFYCGFFMYTRRSERNHQTLTADLQAEPEQTVTPASNNVMPSSSRELLLSAPSTSSNIYDPEAVMNANKLKSLNLDNDESLVDLE